MFSYWYWYFCASAQFLSLFPPCGLSVAFHLNPNRHIPVSASRFSCFRKPRNFLPHARKFLPVYKFIFSRKKIFFLPQRNLFSPGRKFISSRKEISGRAEARRQGAFPTRKPALPLLVTLLVFLSFPFISGFIMIIAMYLPANLLIENSLSYQYLLHTKARKNGSPVFIT